MTIATISNRGQITLPASARKRLGIRPRSKLEVEVRDGEIVLRPLRTIKDVKGIFHEYTKGKTTNWETIRRETMEAVVKEIMDEDRG